MSALEILQKACAQPFAAAHAAREAGRRVVAYLGTSVPVELIRSGGAFAFQLAGDPSLPAPLSDLYLDDEYDGEIRSLFDRIGGGACDVADLIVIPRASNGLLYLYYSLLELRRLEPRRRFPELLLYDVLNTPNWATARYVLDRTRALHARLGGSVDDVRAAIALGNEQRRALHALNARRRAGRLRGSTWWTALRASRVMEPQAWLDAVRALVDEAAPARRLLLKGYGQDTPALYALAESLGANIVADDHLGGERTVQWLVDETAEPLAALAGHYQSRVPTIRSYPQGAEDAAWLALLGESRAQGVLFYHEEFDDTFGWDVPAQVDRLAAPGLPHALLARQSYHAPDRDAQRAVLAGLIESLPT
ncbi:2-hydroxyacyl-CoA dehydratase [Massilia orientalis]|uniref:2-hydroxyacyl-CoA dehydratase n=1 Tax=Massilia orientalis TaxID=3050128 RepID=A0ACC7M2Y6_9BURK|nr:2-hydroxyacyl-CoA dehydratase family protein [Massilia sp. YIM B02787]